MSIVNDIKKLSIGKVIEKPLLRNYTTYKVGGEAICIVYPDDEDCLIKLLEYLKNKNIKYKVLGNGSNVIFSDYKYDLVIIKLDNFNQLKIINNKIIVGAGYPLNKLALRLSRLGFTYSAQTNLLIISGCCTFAATVVSKNSISSLNSSGNYIV